MTPAFAAPAWLVGCGNMAGAMVEGWRAAGVDFSKVTVIRPSGVREGGETASVVAGRVGPRRRSVQRRRGPAGERTDDEDGDGLDHGNSRWIIRHKPSGGRRRWLSTVHRRCGR